MECEIIGNSERLLKLLSIIETMKMMKTMKSKRKIWCVTSLVFIWWTIRRIQNTNISKIIKIRSKKSRETIGFYSWGIVSLMHSCMKCCILFKKGHEFSIIAASVYYDTVCTKLTVHSREKKLFGLDLVQCASFTGYALIAIFI